MLLLPLLLMGGALPLDGSTASSLDWGTSGELKSVPPHRCLQDRTDFRCPWKKGADEREKWQEATSCYPEVIGQVHHLVYSDIGRDAWPQKVIDKLLTNVHSDLQDTQWGPAQQDTQREPAQPGPACPPPFPTDIRKYFRRISRYLKAKGYSPCSWEIVGAEMQVALSGFPGSA
ncbi:interferon alpha-1-like [Psammomys obesus]|uniref:interferon alpha-1-like n=1 Tax=Psammomys obesus TaxID=48139 RepID=UPI0024532940|nr:interferon alpha-1-like [Psammomys obesus]